jgi:hypothetical protein
VDSAFGFGCAAGPARWSSPRLRCCRSLGRLVARRPAGLPCRRQRSGTASEISTDDSGTYILVTGTNRRLSWLTVDGRSGTRDAPRGVRFADW